jgi:hypothetical protein
MYIQHTPCQQVQHGDTKWLIDESFAELVKGTRSLYCRRWADMPMASLSLTARRKWALASLGSAKLLAFPIGYRVLEPHADSTVH